MAVASQVLRTEQMPLRVLFASVAAGGGHNSIRDALVRAVRAADPQGRRVVPLAWTATNGFDEVHRFAVRWGMAGFLFGFSRNALSTSLSVLANVPLLQEVGAVLRRERPDAVVSAHFAVTYCFLLARRLTGWRGRVINVIPDYGPAPDGFFPRHRALRADGTLVNGEDTLADLVARAGVRPGEVQLLGTVVPPPFSLVAEEIRAAGGRTIEQRACWRRELVVGHGGPPLPEVAAIEPLLPTVGVYGGSGFAAKVLPVIDRLLARDPRQGAFNLVVVCGRDEQLQKRLAARSAGRPGVCVLGFLPQAQLARLHGLTDVPLLGSIAHSSLQELLETGTGPLLVHHRIDGAEPPYIDFLHQHRLGTYEPNAEAMTALVEEALGLREGVRYAALARGFAARARTLREQSRRRAARVVQQLVGLAGRPPLAARREAGRRARRLTGERSAKAARHGDGPPSPA